MALTPRGRDQRWLTRHRGLTEQPAGSNRDKRKDGITAAQRRLGSWLIGLAWCGVWACNAALAGGVKIARPYRWASVAAIEDDARAGVNGFHSWVPNRPGPARGMVLRGDLVILFGRGQHVGTFREWLRDRAGNVIGVITDEGNTSSGPGGSQSNGGGAFRRVRPIGEVYGFARVNFPEGGRDLAAVAASTQTRSVTPMRIPTKLVSWLRSSAKTIGLSPKILAPVIGAAITGLLTTTEVTPHDIGQLLGIADTVVVAAEGTIATAIATWLLPPGDVIPTGDVGPANDDLLAAALGADGVPKDQLPAGKGRAG